MQQLLLLLLLLPFSLYAQNEMVPFNHVPTNEEIVALLDENYSPELKTLKNKYNSGKQEEALVELAQYFKEKFIV